MTATRHEDTGRKRRQYAVREHAHIGGKAASSCSRCRGADKLLALQAHLAPVFPGSLSGTEREAMLDCLATGVRVIGAARRLDWADEQPRRRGER